MGRLTRHARNENVMPTQQSAPLVAVKKGANYREVWDDESYVLANVVISYRFYKHLFFGKTLSLLILVRFSSKSGWELDLSEELKA